MPRLRRAFTHDNAQVGRCQPTPIYPHIFSLLRLFPLALRSASLAAPRVSPSALHISAFRAAMCRPSPVYPSDLEAAVLAQRFVLVPSLRSLQNKYPHHDVPSQRSTFDISLNFTCCLHERRQQAIKSSPSPGDEGHSFRLTDRPRGRRVAPAQVQKKIPPSSRLTFTGYRYQPFSPRPLPHPQRICTSPPRFAAQGEKGLALALALALTCT